MRRTYHTLDVFTDTPFAGNPLAVVLDSAGLDTARMQAIAREFNLSETVFLLDSRDPVNTARARIFTPAAELPFAGHPTIGAAALIAHLRAPERIVRDELRIVLEENVGDVVCMVRASRRKGVIGASFNIPQMPQKLADITDVAGVAAALSLDVADIGFEAHRCGLWSAGTPIAFVPVASRDALARARADTAHFARAFPAAAVGVYVYTSEVERETSDVRARMFAPLHGIVEDPATGSAAAAFAGVAVAFEKPDDGDHSLVIEQGFEMGRPSLLTVGLDVVNGELVDASVGGDVVMIAQGAIEA